MAMNGIQARVPLGDRTNHQDAPTVVIEPRDGDLVVWSKGATKIVKAPYDLVLARGSTFYKTLMVKAIQTFNSSPPQNHLDETIRLPSQWETMVDNKKRKKFLSKCFVDKLVEGHCRFLRAAIQTRADRLSITFSIIPNKEYGIIIRNRLSKTIDTCNKRDHREIDQYAVDVVRERARNSGSFPTDTPLEFGTHMQVVGSELKNKASRDLFQHIGIEHPSVLQLEILQSIVFGHQTHIGAFLKTGSGKSAIFLAGAHGLGGVCIVHYPTIPLALDQETKAQLMNTDGAIFVDGLMPNEFRKLQSCLQAYKSGTSYPVPLILMVTIASVKRLLLEIYYLISVGQLKLCVIDEAHSFVQDGLTYRSEFLEFRALVTQKLKPLHTLLFSCSATFTKNIFDKYPKIIGLPFSYSFWGDNQRRRIFVRLAIESDGTYKQRMETTLAETLTKYPETKVLIYSPTATRAEGVLFDMCYSLCGKLRDRGVQVVGSTGVRAMVGDDGLMKKYDIIQSFSKPLGEPHPGDVQICVGTDAMDCGISSNYCRLVIRDGPPASIVQWVQQMGRLARNHLIDEINDQYLIVLSLSSFISMVKRIYRAEAQDDSLEETKKFLVCAQNIQMRDLLQSLSVLVLSREFECYHGPLESACNCPDELAGSDSVTSKHVPGSAETRCEDSCSNCSGERNSATSCLSRQ
jgi:superfamily II DNA helicase RecQ